MAEEAKVLSGTVLAKSSKKACFMMGGDVWYNLPKKLVEANDEAYKIFQQMKKKDEISGTYYEYKGFKNIITLKIDKVAPVEPPKEEKSATAQAPAKEKTWSPEEPPTEARVVKEEGPKSYTRKEDPEKQDQIARGNAVNAIAVILASSKDATDFKTKINMLYAEVDKLQTYIRNGR